MCNIFIEIFYNILKYDEVLDFFMNSKKRKWFFFLYFF